jgi:flagellar basal-body rod modification protein FlgD
MEVGSATNPTVTATSGAGDLRKTQLDYSAFLRLLVAQMKNQDPTEPVDSTQYLAQLASFSAVEQSIKTNSKLDSILATLSLGQADALIGRTVTSADGSVTGKVEALRIEADGTYAVLEGGRRLALGQGVTVS